VFFDPEKAWEFELRRKRGAHLFSKHRYLSAQMAGYLQDGLWTQMATQANANAKRLADGLRAKGAAFIHEPEANMVFARFPRAVHQRLHEAGARYYVWDGALEGDDPDELLGARLVCDWSIGAEQIDAFLSYF
jgi:threonine aldolase